MEPQAELQLLYLLLWRVLRNQEREKCIACHYSTLQVKMKFLAFSMACCNASTRDVCPVPEAIRVPFFAKQSCDLVFYRFRGEN
jgi:hypothetical protein